MGTFSTFDIAGSALSAQSLRLNLTASNLANMHNVAGDPAAVYRARQAVFQAARDPFSNVLAGVDVLGVIESTSPPIERYDPGNPSVSCLSYGLHRSIKFMLAFAIAWLLLVIGITLLYWLFSQRDAVLLDNLSVQRDDVAISSPSFISAS